MIDQALIADLEECTEVEQAEDRAPVKPLPPCPIFENIPEEMKGVNNWVLWKYELRENSKGEKRWTKSPYTADHKHVKANDINTWGSFDDIKAAFDTGKFDGVGFEFSKSSQIMGLDFDHIKDINSNQWNQEALEEIKSLNSYTEVSPSGDGAHVIVFAEVPCTGSGKKNDDIGREMYHSARFFTVTGEPFPFHADKKVKVAQSAVNALFNKWFVEKETVKEERREIEKSPKLEDADIISICKQAKNSEKFNTLYSGDWGKLYDSQSSADLALVSMFAFYTQDKEQIVRLFNRSALNRDKWGRLDYRESTINKVLSGMQTFYTQPLNNTEYHNESTTEVNEITQKELDALKTKQQSLRMPDLSKVLPEDHFLNVFSGWLSGVSDTYYEYQVGSALWVLSSVTQGKVNLPMKQENIKPNLWTFILGRSTTSRKSTAVNKARMIFESAAETTLYNDDFSIEGYLETLSLNPVNNFVRDEAAGLLAKYHKKYNEGIFEAECAIYDNQNYRKTLASGRGKEPKEFTVTSPYVTHLYATTPDNFATYMQLEDFQSGYGYRFLYIFPDYQKSRKPLSLESEGDREKWLNVLDHTRRLNNYFMASAEIKFSVDKEALDLYNKLVEELEDEADKINNGMLSSAIGRAQVHILKLAMLIEIGYSVPSFTIHKHSIELAAGLVREYFLPTCMDVIDRLEEDVKHNQVEKVVSTLRRLGGTSQHSKVLKGSKLKRKEFMECIETLQESGVIEKRLLTDTGAVFYILLSENKPLNASGKKSIILKASPITEAPQPKEEESNPVTVQYMNALDRFLKSDYPGMKGEAKRVAFEFCTLPSSVENDYYNKIGVRKIEEDIKEYFKEEPQNGSDVHYNPSKNMHTVDFLKKEGY